MNKLNELVNSLTDENISDEVKQDIQKEIDALHNNNQKLYARAKTAEGFTYNEDKKEWIKKEKKEPEKKPEVKQEAKQTEALNYSLADIRALNKVHDDDVERVEKFAKSEGVTISEAMKNDDLRAILNDREEKRKTAAVAHTGGGRRGTSSTSSSKLLEEAQKGNYPEDEAGINKLLDAEFELKKNRTK